MTHPLPSPEALLSHYDSAELWPGALSADEAFDVAQAYRAQMALRALRIARGEVPKGFKIGFTNRTIWPRYNVSGPIWGTVWDTTLAHCEGAGSVSLAGVCQPRIEPEVVFGIAKTPPAGATLQQLFECVEWMAPGYEIVQCHLPDWKFKAADTVADGALHGRLLVGAKAAVRNVANDADVFDATLAAAGLVLSRGGEEVDRGQGSFVLGGPLHALPHFLGELRQCPGAPELMPGDAVTTGTWTDAWPVAPGETWRSDFSGLLPGLEIRFV
jgi:2-oxo-3-hexenedioate decarboxylase